MNDEAKIDRVSDILSGKLCVGDWVRIEDGSKAAVYVGSWNPDMSCHVGQIAKVTGVDYTFVYLDTDGPRRWVWDIRYLTRVSPPDFE